MPFTPTMMTSTGGNPQAWGKRPSAVSSAALVGTLMRGALLTASFLAMRYKDEIWGGPPVAVALFGIYLILRKRSLPLVIAEPADGSKASNAKPKKRKEQLLP